MSAGAAGGGDRGGSAMTDREGGLDDLFRFGAERPVEEYAEEAERPPSRAWWIIRNVLLVVAATVVAEASLRFAGISVSVLLIVAAFVALRLLMLAVSQVAPPPLPKRAERAAGRDHNRADDEGLYSWTGSDSLRGAVRRWEQRLSWSQSDAEAFSRNVLPVLAELTDERLRLRHGITRASDPRRARELLGEPVWALLSDPGRRTPRARDLTDYVETLERL
jgi:hypothetical protein